jgi:hypothetical protein
MSFDPAAADNASRLACVDAGAQYGAGGIRDGKQARALVAPRIELDGAIRDDDVERGADGASAKRRPRRPRGPPLQDQITSIPLIGSVDYIGRCGTGFPGRAKAFGAGTER